MTVASAPTRLGVCGWPVAHSRSPAMHTAALAHAGLHGWRYQRLPLPPELFAETVRSLAPLGFRGVNVTIPHKEAALRLADRAEASARAIGAANTLSFEPGDEIHASNTDAPGLIDALPRSLAGEPVLVLGAGGSARAAIWALREAGARVSVWNRTVQRGRAVATDLAVEWSELPSGHKNVVNCTSIGLGEQDAPFKVLPLRADEIGAGSLVVDLVYRPGGTELTRAARAAGATVVDGLEILVAQGARSFATWTGIRPSLHVMREAIADGSRP